MILNREADVTNTFSSKPLWWQSSIILDAFRGRKQLHFPAPFSTFFLLVWLCLVLAVALGIFDLRCSMQDLWLQHRDSSTCGIWDLVPWPGIEPCALGAQGLSHCTTMEVPHSPLLKIEERKKWQRGLASWDKFPSREGASDIWVYLSDPYLSWQKWNRRQGEQGTAFKRMT